MKEGNSVFFYLQLWWYTKMCTKQEEIILKYVYILRKPKKAGLRTACVWKMQIIPLPLATALHRSGHMLLYKQFTYNGRLYQAATRPFRIQIKRLDFRPPRAKEGICVDTKGLSLPHYLLCRAVEWKELWDTAIENTVTPWVCRFIQEISQAAQLMRSPEKVSLQTAH